MNTLIYSLRHLTGEKAYLIYWQQYYHCKPLLSSIMAIDLNLEIITDVDQTLLAFRHDLPEDMLSIVLNTGHWMIWDEQNISLEVLHELRILIGTLRVDLCSN